MLNNFKVRTKILSLILIMSIAIIAISVINIQKQYESNRVSLNVLEKTIRQDYDDNIKGQVNTVITLIDFLKKENQQLRLREHIVNIMNPLVG